MEDILILSVRCTLIGVLVPQSKGDSMRRLISLIAGLSVLIAVAKPIADAAEEIRQLPDRVYELLFPDWEEGEAIQDSAGEWVAERGIRNVENGITALICARWQLEKADVNAALTTSRDESGNIVIDAVRVTIAAACDSAAIESYISDLLACPCHVQQTKGK